MAPTASTYVTLWPAGISRPAVSNLNPSAGQTVPNATITGIDPGDAFNVYNNMGTTHILVDVAGTFDIPWGVAEPAEPPKLAVNRPAPRIASNVQG
ncbi:hypothetical protein [Micromonospora sp. CPCC 206061]|uniref:hypothetical protein n=1 Tax=Micromonospora sp. CPCC 206061 TaxID=3122410 RepID=UPI002FF28538